MFLNAPMPGAWGRNLVPSYITCNFFFYENFLGV